MNLSKYWQNIESFFAGLHVDTEDEMMHLAFDRELQFIIRHHKRRRIVKRHHIQALRMKRKWR